MDDSHELEEEQILVSNLVHHHLGPLLDFRELLTKMSKTHECEVCKERSHEQECDAGFYSERETHFKRKRKR